MLELSDLQETTENVVKIAHSHGYAYAAGGRWQDAVSRSAEDEYVVFAATGQTANRLRELLDGVRSVADDLNRNPRRVTA